VRAIAVSILLASSALGADAPALVVVGPKGETRSLQASDLRQLAVREVTVTEPHGKQSVRYRGAPLTAVLALVGAPAGDALRGPGLALHVRVEASDGYRASFSLAELDAGFGGTDVLVAFERDGEPLGAEIGPFRLVVPTDKRGGRWVRQVVSIKLLD
jgi:DMSO/TMAO reductase YedYZ molybdopterin-dependent catalytic subunit